MVVKVEVVRLYVRWAVGGVVWYLSWVWDMERAFSSKG